MDLKSAINVYTLYCSYCMNNCDCIIDNCLLNFGNSKKINKIKVGL